MAPAARGGPPPAARTSRLAFLQHRSQLPEPLTHSLTIHGPGELRWFAVVTLRHPMRLFLSAALILVCALPTAAVARDFFLTIGGGPRPDNNQVSLESNVIFQQRVLAERRPDHPMYELYFGDGTPDTSDLQYRVADFATTCPPARRILAEVLGDAESMDLLYRGQRLKNVTGPSDPQLLRRRLRDLAKELKPGDRLIVYATAHGGQGKKESATDSERSNTQLYCWNSTSITASEFTDWLDHLDPQVEVMLVMVQCYAGGFANTIFHGADADVGLAPHARFGFFAQVHDRQAAGCTPDVNEADYQEYSSFFWAALAGHTRTGTPITSADYDKDGAVAFAEAHAYAVLESDTIDVPVRTSDVLLRKFSELPKDETDKKPKSEKSPQRELVKLAGPIGAFLERARPEERAILTGLSHQLDAKEATIESLREKITLRDKEITEAAARLARAKQATRRAKDLAKQDLVANWPELAAPYAPLATELATTRADEFVQRVEKLSSYGALRTARTHEATVDKEHLDLQRRRAKLERLLRTAENVVLAANLPLVAPPEIVARHQKIRSLEESTLASRP